MAEQQIQWSTANSVSVSSGSNQTSDAITMTADVKAASIQCKADNGGTPAAGDTLDFYILYTNGDPDGTGSDEYDTGDNTNAELLCRLDTNSTATMLKTVPIQVGSKGFKVYVESNAASNSITASATLYEN